MKEDSFLIKRKRNKILIPADFSIRKLSCFDFFTSTESFTEYNFENTLDIEFPENLSGYVNISPRGFAAFLRLLLSETYGKAVKAAKIYTTDKEIVISIPKDIAFTDLNKLTSLAERSGFSSSEREDALTFSTPMTMTQEFFIFANEGLELINYYYEAFMQE